MPGGCQGLGKIFQSILPLFVIYLVAQVMTPEARSWLRGSLRRSLGLFLASKSGLGTNSVGPIALKTFAGRLFGSRQNIKHFTTFCDYFGRSSDAAGASMIGAWLQSSCELSGRARNPRSRRPAAQNACRTPLGHLWSSIYGGHLCAISSKRC